MHLPLIENHRIRGFFPRRSLEETEAAEAGFEWRRRQRVIAGRAFVRSPLFPSFKKQELQVFERSSFVSHTRDQELTSLCSDMDRGLLAWNVFLL